jgi:signal peptide peptidase SppA
MAENYGHIVNRVLNTPWLIEPEAMRVILEILDGRVQGRAFSDAELRERLSAGRDRSDHTAGTSAGIGVLPLHGPIFPRANMMTEMSGATSLEQWKNSLRALAHNDNVKAIVLDIDSPGGMANMVGETAAEVFAARDYKPIYAVANTDCYSAAYYIGSQATELYSTPSGGVGSVGVLAVHEDETGAMEKEGVKMTPVTAGRFKAELFPFNKLTDEGREWMQEHVNELYEEFTAAVARGRGTSVEDVKSNYGEGRIVTAKNALPLGMIDGIETLDTVVGEVLESAGKTTVTIGNSSTANAGPLRAKIEHVHTGHAEPGTDPDPEKGSGAENEEGDRAAEEGWRLDTPPHLRTEEVANMDDRLLKALRERLGLTAETSVDSMLTEFNKRMDVADDLASAENRANARKKFAEEYPDEYARMQRLEQKDRESEAKLFSEGYARFTINGEKKANGFSARVLEKVEEGHLALSERSFTSENLSEILDSIADHGIVEYGEKGSAKHKGDHVGWDRSNPRKAFSDAVKNLMEQDGLDRKAAVSRLAELEPELVQAYKNV